MQANRSPLRPLLVWLFAIPLITLLCACGDSHEERSGGDRGNKNPSGAVERVTKAVNESVWVINDSLVDSKVFRIDPDKASVVARIRINGAPRGIAAGEGAVWISDFANDRVLRIDPSTNQITARISVPRAPTKIATGHNAVWVISSTEGVLAKIDPSTNAVVSLVPVTNSFLTDVVFGEGAVWVASVNFLLSRIDPERAEVTDAITVIGNPSAVIAGGGSIWLSNPLMKELLRIDLSDMDLTTIKLDRPIEVIAFGQGALWLGAADGGAIVRFDLQHSSIGKAIEVGQKISGLSFGANALWAASKGGDAVYRIDPEAYQITATVKVEGGPTCIAVGHQ